MSSSRKTKAIVTLTAYLVGSLGLGVLLIGTLGRPSVEAFAWAVAWIQGAAESRSGHSLPLWARLALFVVWPPLFCWLALLVAQAATMRFLFRCWNGASLNSRSLIVPSISAGIVVACLVANATEAGLAQLPDSIQDALGWTSLAFPGAAGAAWTLIWLRKDRSSRPWLRFVQQSRVLFNMAALWLVIAAIGYTSPGNRFLEDQPCFDLLFSAVCGCLLALQTRACSRVVLGSALP